MIPSVPVVSVVIGAFNGAEKIDRAIRSLLGQTLSDIELTVVDDGSTDETAEVVRAAMASDPRIRLQCLGRNQGIARSLNLGVQLARASAVAIQDQDDWSEPRRLELQLAVLEARPEVAVVGSRMCEVDERGRELVPRTKFVSGDVTEILMRFNPVANTSAMIRRDVALELGGYDPRYRYANDYDLWLRIADRYRVIALDEVLSTREMSGKNFGASHEREQIAETIAMRIATMRRRGTLSGAAGLVVPTIAWLTPLPLKRLRRRILGQAPR